MEAFFRKYWFRTSSNCCSFTTSTSFTQN